MRVAIVGAGIGGLTLALALAKLKVTSVVFEQVSVFAPVGAGVQLAPNAVRLLKRLGVDASLNATAVRPEALETRRWHDNQILSRLRLGERCHTLYGAPYYTVHRADLHAALLSAEPDLVVHRGRTVRQVTDADDHATITFADGDTARADVVVGADGVHSVVRRALAEDQPRPSGQAVHRGLVPVEALPALVREPAVLVWVGPDKHCVCYPVSGGRQISFAATAPQAAVVAGPGSSRPDQAELVAAYADWAAPVGALTTAAVTVGRWDLYDRPPLPAWCGRRIAVLGDAAHPMLPFLAQGANQAIEDAISLAMCLSMADVPTALATYESLRKPRADMVQERSRANLGVLHRPEAERGPRQAHDVDPQVMGWLYGYDAARWTAAHLRQTAANR